jgi:hypothetical protein
MNREGRKTVRENPPGTAPVPVYAFFRFHRIAAPGRNNGIKISVFMNNSR